MLQQDARVRLFHGDELLFKSLWCSCELTNRSIKVATSHDWSLVWIVTLCRLCRHWTVTLLAKATDWWRGRVRLCINLRAFNDEKCEASYVLSYGLSLWAFLVGCGSFSVEVINLVELSWQSETVKSAGHVILSTDAQGFSWPLVTCSFAAECSFSFYNLTSWFSRCTMDKRKT